MKPPLRSGWQKTKDALTFPLRALTLFYDDKWGLSSLRTERYDYVAREVVGHTLDFGCGRHDEFVTTWLGGDGRGVDVYPYEGLTSGQILQDPTKLPFDDASFDSVAFIANLNHIPEPMRDLELAEAFRVLRPGGNVVATMGNPLAEVLVHRVVYLYDRILKTNVDLDSERGMEEGESYYLLGREIVKRLRGAGFSDIEKRHFWSQWGLNHLYVGWKRPDPGRVSRPHRI